MTTFLIVLGVVLVLALGAFALAFILRKRIMIPDGEVQYSDSDQAPGEVLASNILPLVGKPDYVIKRDGFFIPVEVKTGKTPATPYKNHVAQLYAYCFLVEEHFSKRPPFGILRYPDKEFPLEFTPQAEAGLKAAVQNVIEKKQSGSYRSALVQVCKLCREGKHTVSIEQRAYGKGHRA
jgi:CRISPR-associated exonuclease Cas4